LKRLDRGPAVLLCEHCEKWTPHLFFEERKTSNPRFVVERYVCEDCGTERVWGIGYRPEDFAELEESQGREYPLPVAFSDAYGPESDATAEAIKAGAGR